jgi:hypothetical protein
MYHNPSERSIPMKADALPNPFRAIGVAAHAKGAQRFCSVVPNPLYPRGHYFQNRRRPRVSALGKPVHKFVEIFAMWPVLETGLVARPSKSAYFLYASRYECISESFTMTLRHGHDGGRHYRCEQT